MSWLPVVGLRLPQNRRIKNSTTSRMAIGWHFVLSHLETIIAGSFSTRSRMISGAARTYNVVQRCQRIVSAGWKYTFFT